MAKPPAKKPPAKKQPSIEVEEVEEAAQSVEPVEVPKNTILDGGNLAERLAGLKPKYGLTSTYLVMKEGETKRFVFVGMMPLPAQHPDKEGVVMIDAARLVNEEGNTVHHAGEMIVSPLRGLAQFSAIEITALGKKDGDKGNYNHFHVVMLG